MNENQNERKSINLSKETNEKPRVREAYPVYNHNVNQQELERSEYRNSPSYQSSSQPQNYMEDPKPAVNRYSSPQPQPYQNNANQPGNDDLIRYYNYADPNPPQPDIPPVAPQPAMPPVQQRPVQQPVYNEHQGLKHCKYCGEHIPEDAVVCTHCGRQVEMLKREETNPPARSGQYTAPVMLTPDSDKSKSTSIILAALGFFMCGGIHRFYLGKPISGLLYLFTGGLCCVGTIIDIIRLASGTFRDGAGRIVNKQ